MWWRYLRDQVPFSLSVRKTRENALYNNSFLNCNTLWYTNTDIARAQKALEKDSFFTSEPRSAAESTNDFVVPVLSPKWAP